MALRLDLAPGDVIRIGTGTILRVETKSGSRTRVAIESDYRVTREGREKDSIAVVPPQAADIQTIKRPR